MWGIYITDNLSLSKLIGIIMWWNLFIRNVVNFLIANGRFYENFTLQVAGSD